MEEVDSEEVGSEEVGSVDIGSVDVVDEVIGSVESSETDIERARTSAGRNALQAAILAHASATFNVAQSSDVAQSRTDKEAMQVPQMQVPRRP